MNAKDIKCWHCSKKGHNQSNCPDLKVEGADDGVQNFIIEEFDDGHGLFLTNKEDKCMFAKQGCRIDPLVGSSIHQHMCQLPKHAICSPA
jgi:hypothetical protein